MNKNKLSERDICTKFITPAIQQAGWDIQTQVREEVSFCRFSLISGFLALLDMYKNRVFVFSG